jgi:hypothetical protein
MIGKSALRVIDRVGMDGAVRMPMRNEMAVGTAKVMECEAEIVMAGISGCGFRGGNADTLKHKGHRRRHRHDDGKPSKERSPRELQRSTPHLIRSE